MEHVEVPYRGENGIVKAISHGRWFTVATVDRNKFTPEGRAATADFIATACNCHGELLEALEACDCAFANWQVGQIPGRPDDILALIARVRAAIAKAKNGK